ncbi:MAG: carboxymuconolactone decarboxylase family protein [Pseudomonadales bacterium]|nr:carboxymuconolactone decarboxylase family protein [Pseudomonadales bacterium]NRA17914.1 carboxymuconolactone decarboxylase family protein [Oceanospirillaceae bacterium]
MSVEQHACSINNKLKALIQLRVSQINGCAYCIGLHVNKARAEGNSNKN